MKVEKVKAKEVQVEDVDGRIEVEKVEVRVKAKK